jgi:hypothetical protein
MITIPYSEVQPYEELEWDISHALDLWDLYPQELYVVMDVNIFGDQCIENDPVNGTITCDYDGDGEIDVIDGADRGWLNLNGGPGNDNELVKWILKEEDAGTVYAHKWYPGVTGAHGSSFDAVGDIVGSVVLLPVVDGYCADQNISAVDEMDPNCFNDIASHPDPAEIPEEDSFTWGDDISLGVGKSDYYHVIGFVAFYISCVEDPNAGADGIECPGHTQLELNSPPFPTINANDISIEGYLLSGYTWDTGGADPDAFDGLVNIILLQE